MRKVRQPAALLLNPRFAKYIFAVAALIGYGGWAVYSNIMDGSKSSMIIAWRAGCIQGVYSAILTLVNMLMLEFSYRRFFSGYTPLLARVYAVASVMFAQYLLIVPIHIVNGTPNIFLTLLPGIVIGSLFSYAYVSAYARSKLQDFTS